MIKRHLTSNVLLMAFLVLMTSACHQEFFAGMESANPSETTRISALLIDEEPLTKTQFVDGTVPSTGTLRMLWSAHDQMDVWYMDQNHRAPAPWVSTNDEPVANAYFEGLISGGSGGDAQGGEQTRYYYAYYPYALTNSLSNGVISTSLPVEQPSVHGNNVHRDLVPWACRSVSTTFYFYQVAAAFRFKPMSPANTDYGSQIQYVEYSGNSNEILAGDFSFSFNENGIPVASVPSAGSKTIRLFAPDYDYCGTFNEDTWYYLVLLPQVLNNAYTIKVHTQYKIGTFTASGSRSLTRGSFFSYGSMATSMTFEDRPTALASVTVSGTNTVSVGGTTSLSAAANGYVAATSATPDLTSQTTFRWFSSDETVATVDENGVVTGVAEGTANIYAIGKYDRINVKSSDFTVTVGPAITLNSVTISGPKTVNKGGTITLSAEAKDEDGNKIDGASIKWYSRNTSIATVNEQTGVVTGVSDGTAKIYAIAEFEGNEVSSSDYSVTSQTVLTSVSISPSSVTLFSSQTTTLTATAKDAMGNSISGASVTWSVQSGSSATVDNNGKVSATTTTGKTTIKATVTYKGVTKTATCTVTVRKLARFQLVCSTDLSEPASGDHITIPLNGTKQFIVKPYDTDGKYISDFSVNYIVQDTNIATVSKTSAKATVKGVSSGSTTFTVRVSAGNTVTQTYTLDVN